MATEQAAKPRNGGQHSYVLASIPVEMIELQEQVRQDWEYDDGAEKMRGLTETIKEWGILQPLLVKPIGNGGRYRLVAGHRRYKSAVEAGDLLVPCMIWNGDDGDIPLIQLIENTQRQHLSFANKAAALQKRVDRGQSSVGVDREWGVPNGTTAKIVRIAGDSVLMSAIGHGLIGESVADMLMGLHDNYSAPLYDALRNYQPVTRAMVDKARELQRQEGVAKDVNAGQRGLTDHTKARIGEAHRLTMQGLTIKEIAAHLGVSESRAKSYRHLYQQGPVGDNSLSRQDVWSQIAALSADGLTQNAISLRLGLSHDTVRRTLRDIERDAVTPPAPNYFAQPDSDQPIPNAARSVIPLRTDHPTMSDAPPPGQTLPKPGSFFWDNTGEDAWPQVKATTGLKVDIDTRDYLVDAVQTKDRDQAGATLAPIPPRYVADPALADMTVMLREHIRALLKLLAWAGDRGMTVPQLHDEIKALYSV